MLTIRSATPDDLDTIIRFINELAEYEQLSHAVAIDRSLLNRELFGKTPYAWALMAQWDQAPAGFAVCYYHFSTFKGKHGIFIEDLYVSPLFRGKGIGRGLMQAIARRALDEGCDRIDWEVLDWNTPSIDFYQQLGAHERSDWLNYRLDKTAIESLAAEA